MTRPHITPTEKYTWAVFDARPDFPTVRKCPRCEGECGVDTRPRYGGDPMEDNDYYWDECDECGGEGEFYNPTVKCVRHYRINLRRVAA